MKTFLVFISIIFLMIVQLSFKPKGEFYRVLKVVDGDTFYVDNGTQKALKVRLIGVDTPETRDNGRKKMGYYGEEAKQYLKTMINGKMVRLETDVQKFDRYQRLLVYAYTKEGLFINADLIEKGYAVLATFPPNVRHVDLFIRLQKQACANKRGLWK